MSVEFPVLQVVALADRLRAVGMLGSEAAARLRPLCGLGEVSGAVESFLACTGLVARATAEGTELLAQTIAGVAESWLALDRALLARRQQVLTR